MSDTKTVRRPIKWRYSESTHVGVVREVNEDSILSRPEVDIWAVADGMGGHELGDVASKMVVEGLEAVEKKRNLEEMVNVVEDHLLDANDRILEYADIMLEQKTLGSTVVVLIICGRVGVCLWAGDSRLYRYRKSQFLQLSRDHSQTEELVQQGFLKPEDAEGHPESNVITRAIGVDPELYIDINVFSVQAGDTFLLCSDGLYNSVGQEDITHNLSQSDVNGSVDGLIEAALENGASDNVSAIVVRGELSRPVSRRDSPGK